MGQKWKREGAEENKIKSDKIKCSSRDAEAFQHSENATAYLFTMWQAREFCSPVFKVTFSKENKHTLHDHRKDFLTNTRVSALRNVTPLNSLERWVFNPAPFLQSFCAHPFSLFISLVQAEYFGRQFTRQSDWLLSFREIFICSTKWPLKEIGITAVTGNLYSEKLNLTLSQIRHCMSGLNCCVKPT